MLFPLPPTQNLLPFDGEVFYCGIVCDNAHATKSFEALFDSVAWEPDKAVMFGKTIYTKRKVAWYGSLPFSYSYSKTTKVALPWTPVLLELKLLAEQQTGETYNSCLLNLYHNGNEGMAWHSDGETDLKKNGAIASMSFGAARKFAFKHKKTGDKVEIVLEHGSLLLMKGETQTHWLHRLPPTTKVNDPRINLTFRTIVNHP